MNTTFYLAVALAFGVVMHIMINLLLHFLFEVEGFLRDEEE